MARYLLFGKYNATSAAAINRDGMVSRRKVMEDVCRGLGGKMVDCYAIAVPNDYDFVITMDHESMMSPGQMMALNLTTTGSGGFERALLVMLASFEEVDEARNWMPAYSPPGR
jgi:hypothetical protein